MTHANAYLTPRGRLALAQLVVDAGWTYRRAAERFQCSPSTAKKWADRYRAGDTTLNDRSSRLHSCPHRTPTAPNDASSKSLRESRRIRERDRRLGWRWLQATP